jgi:hypothetical protein
MFQEYKEIFFGLAFGIAAFVIDWAMDAAADGNSLLDELTEHPAMLLYRLVFVLLGLVLGWLIWKRHRTEREFQRLREALSRIQQQCGNQALMLRSTLQTLLTRNDLGLSAEAEQLVQEAYQRSQEFQRIAGEKAPLRE